jgi:hypothetical protein
MRVIIGLYPFNANYQIQISEEFINNNYVDNGVVRCYSDLVCIKDIFE